VDSISGFLDTFWTSIFENDEEKKAKPLQFQAYNSAHPLMQNDVLQNIVVTLDVKAMGRLTCVSRQLKDSCRSNTLWQIIAARQLLCVDVDSQFKFNQGRHQV